MALKLAVAALAATVQISSAAPSVERSADANTDLRLVKTSPEDPGQWVTEAQKFELFTSRGIGFIDITNIDNPETLRRLSTDSSRRVSTNAVTYPTTVEHRDQFDTIYGLSDITQPQEWLEHLAG